MTAGQWQRWFVVAPLAVAIGIAAGLSVEKVFPGNQPDIARTIQERDLLIIRTTTKAQADAAKKALESGQAWAAVAKQYSNDPQTKRSGGVAKGAVKGQQDPAVDKAAFAGDKDKAYGPIHGSLGWYIVRVVRIYQQKPDVSLTARDVAVVGSTPITKTAYYKWISIALRSTGSRSLGNSGRDQVLQLLITSAWITGEAEQMGISMSHAEVMKRFLKTKRQAFPEESGYQKFLRLSGETQADILSRIKIDALSTKIRDAAVKGAKGRKEQQSRLQTFVKTFQTTWKQKTLCGKSYIVDLCRNASSTATVGQQPAGRLHVRNATDTELGQMLEGDSSGTCHDAVVSGDSKYARVNSHACPNGESGPRPIQPDMALYFRDGAGKWKALGGPGSDATVGCSLPHQYWEMFGFKGLTAEMCNPSGGGG